MNIAIIIIISIILIIIVSKSFYISIKILHFVNLASKFNHREIEKQNFNVDILRSYSAIDINFFKYIYIPWNWFKPIEYFIQDRERYTEIMKNSKKV